MPIAWYYEWLILVIIGAIAFVIAYGIVGALYDGDFIDGRGVGSFILINSFDDFVFGVYNHKPCKFAFRDSDWL